jgi:hypothetical protein
MNDNIKKTNKSSYTIVIGEIIFNRLDQLIRKSFSELSPYYRLNRSQWKIYLPILAHQLLMEYCRQQYMINMFDHSELKHFNGLSILQGYENAIVLAHDRAYERLEEHALVFKAPLS